MSDKNIQVLVFEVDGIKPSLDTFCKEHFKRMHEVVGDLVKNVTGKHIWSVTSYYNRIIIMGAFTAKDALGVAAALGYSLKALKVNRGPLNATYTKLNDTPTKPAITKELKTIKESLVNVWKTLQANSGNNPVFPGLETTLVDWEGLDKSITCPFTVFTSEFKKDKEGLKSILGAEKLKSTVS